jgi:hypothetical protein
MRRIERSPRYLLCRFVNRAGSAVHLYRTMTSAAAVTALLVSAAIATAPSAWAADPALAPTTQSVDGVVGSSLATSALTATGFTGAPAFAIVPDLPPGLSLDSASGAIGGTPSTAGAYTGTITATFTDSSVDPPVTQAATASITLSVSAIAVSAPVAEGTAPASLTPATQTLTSTVGVPVSPTAPFTASGFAGAVTYSIDPASLLPSGLVFDAATGVISGTPSVAILSSGVTVIASDGTTTAAATVAISVAGPNETRPVAIFAAVVMAGSSTVPTQLANGPSNPPNTPMGRLLTGGVRLVSRSNALSAPVRFFEQAATLKRANAPTELARRDGTAARFPRAGDVVRLVAVVPADRRFRIRMRVDGQPYRMGVGLSTDKGLLSIPAFVAARAGSHTVVFVNATSGTKRFVKVEIGPRR